MNFINVATTNHPPLQLFKVSTEIYLVDSQKYHGHQLEDGIEIQMHSFFLLDQTHQH